MYREGHFVHCHCFYFHETNLCRWFYFDLTVVQILLLNSVKRDEMFIALTFIAPVIKFMSEKKVKRFSFMFSAHKHTLSVLGHLKRIAGAV